MKTKMNHFPCAPAVVISILALCWLTQLASAQTTPPAGATATSPRPQPAATELTPQELHRQQEAAAVMPHAAMPMREIINDELLKQIPADAAFFREFLAQAAKSEMIVSVIFPVIKSSDGHRFSTQPYVALANGFQSFDYGDGRFSKIDVLLKWGAFTAQTDEQTAARVEMVLTASYMMGAKTAALILPFEATVSKNAKDVYEYRDVKVNFKELAVVTKTVTVPAPAAK